MAGKIFKLIIILIFTITAVVYAQELTPQLCKQKAIAAAKLIETEGDAALKKIKDPSGEFRFAQGKGYVWVHDLDGIMVMHPVNPALEGKDLLKTSDSSGFYLFLAFNEMVKQEGAGWVAYMWSKPGEKESSPKISYVLLVEHGNKQYVVGCGMYDVTAEYIKEKFPGDLIYEQQ